MAGRLSRAFLIVAMLTAVAPAQAGIILNGAGHAVEVTDVLVNGNLYNVTFGVGSYNDIFGTDLNPDPLPTFEGMQTQALAALVGIVSQLNAASVNRVADSLGNTSNFIIVPHLHNATSFNGESTIPVEPLPWGTGSFGGSRTGTSFGSGFIRSFALFTPAAAEVPEPASFTLLAMGGVTLCGLRLRRKLRACT